jgi:glutamate-1-semialdehyde 2,1-aminomutase
MVEADVEFYDRLKARRAEFEDRYRALTPASARLARAAEDVLPGGTTRDTVVRRPHPLFVASGAGGRVTDADGRTLVDLWLNATALPLGHADPRVAAAASAWLAKGTVFYAPTGLEADLAREIARRLPSAERVRFANSGTEAVMLAARIARAHTRRALVAKFEGSYHGSWDDVQWSVGAQGDGMGPASAPEPVAATGGLVGATGRALVLPYNDLDATARLLDRHGWDVAALLVEPIANRMGLVLPKPGFLQGLRDLCDRHGIVLVFDEIISFRLGYHGAQGLAGVTPDLTTLGKLIGGGFPVGAVAGRAGIMAVTEAGHPTRVAHAGTFTANPLTMAAGKATLDALTPEAFDRLNAEGERLRAALRAACQGRPLQVSGAGSLFKISATPQAIVDHRSSLAADAEWEDTASLALLCDGFFLTTRLHGCLCTAHEPADVDRFVEAVGRVVHG